MQKQNAEQLIICDRYAIFYLTGELIDPGERFFALYISLKTRMLFVNKIFFAKKKIKAKNNIELFFYNEDLEAIERLAEEINNNLVLVDQNFKAKFLLGLTKLTHNNYILSNVVENIRLIKDQEEIYLMRESSRLNDKVMEKIIKNICEDQSELDLIRILDNIKQELKIKYSFYPIVAFGKNCAEPHHVSNETKLKSGDAILIDIGFIKNNYCSDMTRTVFYKYVSDLNKNIYEIVLNAQERAIKKIKPDIKFSEIDSVAREYIKQNNYGKYFTHTTGHSIGLECHESGTVSYKNNNLLKSGMIISIEPGIYLENQTGVRIEDLVLVTQDSYEILNNYSKKIIVIK